MAENEEPPEIPGRSFLTKAQREYLFGKDFDSQRERQIRFEMRKNFQSALMDLQLLWSFSEKDQYLATLPLSAFYEFDGVADWVLEEKEVNLQGFSSNDVSDADQETGGLMHQGIVDLLTLFADWYGPSAFEKLVQQALHQATLKQAQERGQDIGAYEIELNGRGESPDVA